MVQSKAFVDASHALNELSHALALLESENSSLRGAVDGFASENAKLRELVDYMTPIAWYAASERERDRMRELGVEA